MDKICELSVFFCFLFFGMWGGQTILRVIGSDVENFIEKLLLTEIPIIMHLQYSGALGIGVRDQFRLGGLRSVARIFYPLLAR